MKQTTLSSCKILLVDDNEQLLRSYSSVLNSEGFRNLLQCSDSRNVEKILSENEVAVVLLDLNMPHINGRDILPVITGRYPEIQVLVITAANEVTTAVECMRAGAFDYLVKPIEPERLVTRINCALEAWELRVENSLLNRQFLADELMFPESFSRIITVSKSMRDVFKYVEAVAGTSHPMLITGETGVGKELIADAIHRLSRREGDFVPVNVAGVDDNVFSDTLFGHVKGAFTGAQESRKGLIERARNGTLFLDEIGELKNESQVKLLRLLQEGEYRQLGSDDLLHSNARIVVATNRDLRAMQEAGKFRDDLYYRLRSHHVQIPPLRERPEDLPVLVKHFLAAGAMESGKPVPTAPPELVTLLANYPFPGNIRELEAMVFDAVSRHKSGVLSMNTFKDLVLPGKTTCTQMVVDKQGKGNPLESLQTLPTMNEIEDMAIQDAMRRTGGNQSMAAELLGISRQTLNRRLQ